MIAFAIGRRTTGASAAKALTSPSRLRAAAARLRRLQSVQREINRSESVRLNVAQRRLFGANWLTTGGNRLTGDDRHVATPPGLAGLPRIGRPGITTPPAKQQD
jgi:hypothetical protein